MQTKLSDWQRIESIIEWANMTTNYFAREIGLARGENLYQIKRGNNGISRRLAQHIVERFPEINVVWLLTGAGEMFAHESEQSAKIPHYEMDVELHIRDVDSLEPSSYMLLPPSLECDLAMVYRGRAMASVTPINSVVLLKKIEIDDLILGDECVVISKKFILLRKVKSERGAQEPTFRLVAADSENYDDIAIAHAEVEALYKVKGKIVVM